VPQEQGLAHPSLSVIANLRLKCRRNTAFCPQVCAMMLGGDGRTPAWRAPTMPLRRRRALGLDLVYRVTGA
jgi:hypothetical protein